MKLELDGHDEVRVGTPADDVADALADPDQLLALLDGMIRPASTRERWVVAEIHAGPVRLTPAVDVDVARPESRRVTIAGRPVAGHTPAHLDLVLVVHAHDDGRVAHSTVASRWDVAVDVPGPQLLVRTIRPLMVASSRSVMRQLADRLRDRFDLPPTT